MNKPNKKQLILRFLRYATRNIRTSDEMRTKRSDAREKEFVGGGTEDASGRKARRLRVGGRSTPTSTSLADDAKHEAEGAGSEVTACSCWLNLQL
jgi:hypothetical protein